MAAYTPSSLAEHLLGELNVDRNAHGGTVPDRMEKVVQEAYEHLWECHDWLFRRTRDTVTLTAGTATADLPSDFVKFDTRWMTENNQRGSCLFTDDETTFEQWRDQYASNTSRPVIGIVEPDRTGETYASVIRFAPTPSEAFEYTIIYICEAPAVTSSSTPMWPKAFFEGWKRLARYKAIAAFRRDKNAWEGPYRMWLAWLNRAMEQNNETMATSTPAIRDGYGDVGNLMSSHFLAGGVAGADANRLDTIA